MSERAVRRGLLGAALLALGGCGFRPLYGDGRGATDPGIATEFAATRVSLIPERFGQLLRQSLQRRLGAGGPATAARWDLTVSPSFAAEGIGVQRDGAATRVRYVATANWTFNRVTPRETVANGFERAIDAYNVQPNQFFAADTSRDALERRLAEQLADDVVARLALRIRDLQSGASARLIAPVATPPTALEPLSPVRPLGGASPGLGGDLEGGIGGGLGR